MVTIQAALQDPGTHGFKDFGNRNACPCFATAACRCHEGLERFHAQSTNLGEL